MILPGIHPRARVKSDRLLGYGVMKPEQHKTERLRHELARMKTERDILKNQRGLMPPVGVETVLRYLACGRERPSTFWWHVTP